MKFLGIICLLVLSACGGGGSKFEVAKVAVQKFIKSIPSDVNVGLVRLNAGMVVELGTGNRDALMRAVEEIDSSGGTPLKSSMQKAYEVLTRQGQRQLGYGMYRLVMVTDGEANLGEDPQYVVSVITSNSPVIIHTIGFCIGPDHSLNQPGRTYYAEANSPEELKRGLESVLAEAPTFGSVMFRDGGFEFDSN